MSDTENKLKVVIPPEVLEQLEQQTSPEELQEFISALQQMADSGELFEAAEPVDFSSLAEDDPELYAALTAQMKDEGFDDLEAWVDSKVSNAQRPLH